MHRYSYGLFLSQVLHGVAVHTWFQLGDRHLSGHAEVDGQADVMVRLLQMGQYPAAINSSRVLFFDDAITTHCSSLTLCGMADSRR
jgi:hypothetical protein